MILVVDDAPEMREVLTVLLEDAGYSPIWQAPDAETALRMLGVGGAPREVAPALVLMDIMMPGIDGIEATARIVADPGCDDVAVIIVSSVEESERLNPAFVAGAADYVMKPVKPVPLVARVKSVLRLRFESMRRRERERALEEANRALSVALAAGGPAVDPATGLPGLRLVTDRLAGRPAAATLAAIGIDAFGGYRSQLGEAAAADLRRRVGDLIAALPGRRGDLLAADDDGRFLLLTAPMTTAEQATLGRAVNRAVLQARIPHPRSVAGPSVTVGTAVGGVDAARAVAAPESILRALDDAMAGGPDAAVAGLAFG